MPLVIIDDLKILSIHNQTLLGETINTGCLSKTQFHILSYPKEAIVGVKVKVVHSCVPFV